MHVLTEEDEERSKRIRNKLYREKLPEIKTVRYVIKKNVHSDKKTDKLLFNFMNPTVNSLLNAKKKPKPRHDAYKKLCSVDCIDRTPEHSRAKLRKSLKPRVLGDPFESRIYYPTLRQYLIGDKSRVEKLPIEIDNTECLKCSRTPKFHQNVPIHHHAPIHQHKSRICEECKYYDSDPYFRQKYEDYQLICSKKVNFSKI